MALDPTRTKVLRRRFMQDAARRFRKLQKAVITLIVTDDAFGLEEEKPFKFNARKQYKFLTDNQKVKQFRIWLQTQIDAGLLEVVGGVEGQPWTAQYVESVYRKGMMRAYTDTHKETLSESPAWYRGTQEQFVRDAFLQPEMLSKVQLLNTRTFEGMKGVTESVGTQLNRLLAEGLVNGRGPKVVAREIKKAIPKLKNRALTIARTEIIHAHAEGQLDAFKMLGIEEVGAEVEFSTANDALVCPICYDLEGKVYKVKDAHGIIPVHPRCRCGWKPNV